MRRERVRTFTKEGLDRLEAIIVQARNDHKMAGEIAEDVQKLAFDPQVTRPYQEVVEVDLDRQFPTRYEMAEYLCGQLQKCLINNPSVRYDRGLWSWLAAAYFFQGVVLNRPPFEVDRFVYNPGFGGYRSHFIAAPSLFYWDHRSVPDLVRPFLDTPPYRLNEYFRECMDRGWLMGNVNLLRLIVRLYYDYQKKKWKQGGNEKSPYKPGTLRRLILVLSQLDLTYDLWSLHVEELLALLPKDFERWMTPDTLATLPSSE